MESAQLVPLKFLLTAKNKQTVATHFADSFAALKESLTDKAKLKTAGDFNIKPDEAAQLIEATRYVISQSIYYYPKPPAELFPEAFHANLRDLISQIISANMKAWREASLATQGMSVHSLIFGRVTSWIGLTFKNAVSLPRLQALDWRVDIKGASDQMAQMHVPTVFVELKLVGGTAPTPSTVQFELSSETLRAVLEGLGKIRDQLNAVNQQAS